MRTLLKITSLILFISTATTTLSADPLVVTPSSTPVTCSGGNDGTASVVVTGGTEPYSYKWYYEGDLIPGAITSSINGVAGNYVVMVTDAALDEVPTPIAITQPTSITIFSVITKNLICNGNNSGEIKITAIPGTGALEYSVNNGASYSALSTITGLPASALYRIIVRDANLCTKAWASNPVTLTEPPALSIIKDSQTNISCKGGNNGDIKVTGSGGTGLLTYTLKKVGVIQSSQSGIVAGTQVDFPFLTAGDYTVEVTDENLCGPSITPTITLTEPAVALSVIATPTNATAWCKTDGSISAAGSGGTSPYRYSKDGITFTAPQAGPYIFSSLSPNSYTITVKDANDCTATDTKTIGPATLSATVVPTDATCYGGTGKIVVTAAVGGSGAGYGFALTSNGLPGGWKIYPPSPVQFLNLASSPAPGTPYTVYMKDGSYDLLPPNNCPSVLLGTFYVKSPAALTSNISGTTSICLGGSATISIAFTGVGPWNVTYTDGTTPVTVNNIVASPYTFSVSPIVNTTYTVTALTNNVPCTALVTDLTGSAVITVNTSPSITAQPINSTICAGASTTFGVTASGVGLTYQWQLSTNGGGTWNDQPDGGVYSNMTTSTMTITGATTLMNSYRYRCVVSGTCPPPATSSSAILTVNALPTITVQPVNRTICAGDNTTFSVTATGAGLTYQWQLSIDAGVTWNDQADGGVYSNMTTATMTITGAIATMSGYRFRCVVSGTCTPSAISVARLLTVRTAPAITTQPINSTICEGANTTFRVVATGSVLTYQWQLSSDAGVTWNDQANGGVYSNMTTATMTITGATALMNNYRYRCVVSGFCPPPVTSNAGILTVNTLPSITGQPINSTICAGTNTTFGVTASGSNLTYQWQLSTNGGVTWVNQPDGGVYSNMITATMTITGATALMNNYQYRCMVSGTCPPIVYSNAAILTVNALPTITVQPISRIVCAGDNTTFSVTATGAGLTYQWQLSIDAGVTWNDQADGGVYSNMTTATMTITGATVTMTGYRYRCVISGTCPPSVTSVARLLTVRIPPAITTQPINRTICEGANTTFSVIATGSVLTYQWQLSTDAGVTWNNQANGGVYSNMTTATMTISGATTSMNNYRYRCVVSGYCPPPATSNAGILTVNALPSITTQPINSTICAGSNTTFGVTASGAGLTYQWQLSTNAGVTWNNQANGGVYTNMTTAIMTITGATALMNNYQYRCVVSGTCPPSATSNAATLTVNTAPGITGQPINSTICEGSNTTFGVTASGAGLTYQWQLSTDGGVIWNDQADGGVYSTMTTATMTITGATALMNNYQYRCVVSGTCPPPATSTAATLSVNELPSITGQPINSTICEGFNTTFGVTASGTGLTYQWQLSTDGGVIWNDQADGGVYSTMTTATMTITGATALMNNYQYRCVVSGTCLPSVTSNAATLTINTAPSITIHPISNTICEGLNTTFGVTASGAGLTYQWQLSTDGGVTWSDQADGGVYSTMTTATMTITGATTLMNNYQYRCVVSGTCLPSATSNAATLTVDTAPSITIQPINSTICEGLNTTFGITASGAGLTYQWQLSTDGGVTWNDQADGGVYSTMTTATMTITGATTLMNNYQYRCVVSGTCLPSATSNAATLTVDTAPSIIIQPINSTICEGLNTTFGITASGAGLTYQWQLSTDGGVTWNDQADGGVYSTMTTATMTITGATALMNNYQYQCVVSGTCLPFATSNAGILTVDTAPAIITQPTNQTTCSGTSVSFNVVASGAGLTYQWRKAGFDITGANSATYTIATPIIGDAGNYDVVVSGTCVPPVTSSTVSLTVNDTPSSSVFASDVSICNGSSANLNIIITGGTSPYTVIYSDGSGNTTIGGYVSGTDITVSPIVTTTYSLVSVTDANLCSSLGLTGTPTVTVNQGPTASVLSGGETICSGSTGTLIVNITNGTAPFTVVYNDGISDITENGYTSGSDITVTPLSTTTYTLVSVTDANGCISTGISGSATITVNAPLSWDAVTKYDITCHNLNNGKIKIEVSVAPLPYTFSRDGGVTFGDSAVVYSNLAGGTYFLAVKDGNNCVSIFPDPITPAPIIIKNPDEIVITTLSIVSPNCSGEITGSISVDAVAGGDISISGSYRYKLDNVDAIPVTNNAFTGLTAGNHTISVIDDNDCRLDSTITITEPPALVFTIQDKKDITCNGLTDGSITLEVSGGTAPYSYSITGGAPFTSTDGIFTGLTAGGYTAAAEDNNGCIAPGGLPFTVVDPPAISITAQSFVDFTCSDGTGIISVDATGGTDPLVYNLYDNAHTLVITNGDGEFTIANSDTYTVEVTDVNGCGPEIAGPFTLTKPAPFSVTTMFTQITMAGANDGTITAIASGGTPEYSYDLYKDGLFDQTLSPILPDSAKFTALSDGTYTVLVTDANSCTVVSDPPIILSGMSVTVYPHMVSCFGLSDGHIGVLPQGGTPPYTVLCIQMPGSITMPDTINLPAGDYIIDVTDNTGVNVKTLPITITQPAVLAASLAIGGIQNKLCNGDPNGSVTFDITGGTPPYSITWTGTATGGPIVGNVATDIGEGTYDFTITDANLCSTIVTGITLTDPPKLNITDIAPANPLCNGGASGSITVIATGGTNPLVYTLTGQPDNATGIFNNLPVGTYTVGLTDLNGCIASFDLPLTSTVVLTEPAVIVLDPPSFTNQTCLALGTITVTASGGTGTLTYNLSTGESNTTGNFDVEAGDYTVTVTDENGCSSAPSIDIPISAPPAVQIDNVVANDMTGCAENANGSIVITASGGTPSYTYSLYNELMTFIKSQGSNTFTDLGVNSYQVVVSDINGCSDTTSSIVITTPYYMNAEIVEDDKTICYGTSYTLHALSHGLLSETEYSYSWFKTPVDVYDTLGKGSIFTVKPLESTKYFVEIRHILTNCLSVDTVTIGVYPKIGTYIPPYISAVQNIDDRNIISILSGTSYNMDMNTQSTEYETTFKWVPSILFSPPDSWNSSIYVDDAIYAQIHGYDTLMYDSQARRKINFTKIFGIDSTSVGCTDTLKLYLRLVDKLSFGNVFSPNGDGVNDVWLVPKDYLFPDLEIEIFNRWGSLVWSAKGDEAAKGWNGRTNKGNELPIGTYYYVIKFNIKTNDGKWKPINGSITIVR